MSLGAHRASSTREYQLLHTSTIDSTGTQTYTIPAGILYIEIEMWGAGGGGGLGKGSAGRGGSSFQEGGGGGGGAYVKHKIWESILREGRKLSFTVGAGGDGADLAGGDECKGDAGGNTSFTGILDESGTSMSTFTAIIANGGCGGDSGNQLCIGGGICYSTGGVASGGNIANKNGVDGTDHGSIITSSVDGQNGGAAGGLSVGGGAGGAGGTDDGSSSAAGGENGVAPGGGGGGGASSCAICATLEIGGDGGIGANGRVIVRSYG